MLWNRFVEWLMGLMLRFVLWLSVMLSDDAYLHECFLNCLPRPLWIAYLDFNALDRVARTIPVMENDPM